MSEYHVSPEGIVTNISSGKVLKPSRDRRGYWRVWLYEGGVRKERSLHRLVALTYLPNPDNKPQVNHIDGDKENNSVTNLEWCSNSENKEHARIHGLCSAPRGEKQHLAKLTREIVSEIRARYLPRCPVNGSRALAREFGVAQSTVSNILRNKTWIKE